MLIVYGITHRFAEDWSRVNIKAHDRLPVTASPNTIAALRGVRDSTWIILDDTPLPMPISYYTDRNTIINVRTYNDLHHYPH